MRAIRFLSSGQRGQILIFTALILPVLLGMTAVAIDVGSYADDKRNLQNAADAIALAAARDMCTPDPHSCSDTSAAQATASTWAAKNNISPGIMTVTFLGGNAAPKVRVRIEHPHRFAFARVIGIKSKNVGATAASVKISPGGVPGVVPFGVTQATLDAAGSGNLATLKYDSQDDTTPGNFGAIDIDKGGSSTYQTDLQYGSPSTVCSTTTAGCDKTACANGGAFPTACTENAPDCSGPQCNTETGNMIGSTGDAVQYRLDHTSAACDTFDEVFSAASASANEIGALLAERQVSASGRMFSPALAKAPTKTPTKTNTPTNTPGPATNTPTPAPPTNTPTPKNNPKPTNTAVPTDTPTGSPTPVQTSTPQATATPSGGGSGKYSLNPACNPWGAGGCASTTEMCSRRVIVVPIVDQFANGSKPVIVQGFALFWLEGFAGGQKCQGSNCQVQGRFVKADVTMSALTGLYNPDSSIQYERLVE
jgi:hypothetical protein